jgi:hypothetical protein
VRLAGTAGADEEYILTTVKIFTLDQLQQLGLIDTGAGREVELVEQLSGREAGGLQAPLRILAFPFDELQLAEFQQDRQMVGIVCGAPLRNLLTLGEHRRQLEGFQVMFE